MQLCLVIPRHLVLDALIAHTLKGLVRIAAPELRLLLPVPPRKHTTPTRTEMRVLISGAGISGNSIAFWLSKLGHDITVIERFPTLRASGLQVDLRGHGSRVMKLMGLEEAFESKRILEQGLEFVGSSGRRWAYFPAGKGKDGLQSFSTEFEIMRGDLCQILHDATNETVRYIYGDSIEGLEEVDDCVEVRFQHGPMGRFGLVIGADGQGSRTRKLMLGPDTPDAFRPLGDNYTGYLTIPWPIQEGEQYRATVYSATRGRGIMMRRHSPDRAQAYLTCSSSSDRMKNAYRKGVQEEKEALAEVFQGAGWKTEELLKVLMTDNDFYCERIGMVKMDHWSRGRVALVGDAAYCPSANTGMGTTCAIVGAYILAGEIGQHCGKQDTKDSLTAALEAYQTKFQPFMDQVQRGLLEGDGVMNHLPTTTMGITLMNCLIGLASFFKVDLLSRFVLREDIKDWDLPQYTALLGRQTARH